MVVAGAALRLMDMSSLLPVIVMSALLLPTLEIVNLPSALFIATSKLTVLGLLPTTT